MKSINYLVLLFIFLLAINKVQGQTHTQAIYGKVVDQDSKMALIGATIKVQSGDQLLGGGTDFDGDFRIEKVPVGRLNIEVTYLGYEPVVLSSITLSSGKELNLTIEMQESTADMEEVVVSAENNRDKAAALNEMATVSARSFSVEETGRYAGSFADPSRMVTNYAGVSVGGGTFDLSNEIVVRGNSPSGLLWRMEGIEIPNPNHFADVGSSGGSVSMLNSNTLSTSDFFTGAFPGEYGNATSGVFDLNLRNGNNQKHEFTLGIGLLGIEAAAEGYFSKKSKASFLINYRYSTLGLVQAMGLNPVGDALPSYQDLSFKINLPAGKAGTFTLWGIGGDNTAYLNPEKDSLKWEKASDNDGYDAKGKMGVVGLSHRIIVSENSYLKTVVALSGQQSKSEYYELAAQDDYQKDVSGANLFNRYSIRATTAYTHKFGAKNTLKAGVVFNQLNFGYDVKRKDENTGRLKTFLDNKGATQLLQAYASWKYRPHTNWGINAGLHYSYLTLNKKYAIEPRLSAKWNFAPKHSISVGGGIHSRMEDISYYFVEVPNLEEGNKNLELKKAVHAVLGYDFAISKDINLKIEAYYQYLYDVPVENETESTLTILNTTNIFEVLNAKGMVSEGLGRNFGLDLTFEKFFSKQYYILFTASVYDSKYQAKDGNWYNTRFNTNYNISLLGGKEFKVGKNKNNTFGLNSKFILAGGSRYTPVDVEQSRAAGRAIYVDKKDYTEQVAPYVRLDFGLSYKINMKKMTHTIGIDIQNVINYNNIFTQAYNVETEKIEYLYQGGIFPNINYKIQF
ncbi:TonB-dependent receptor [Aureispira anguillae]|uniref:TonB-dependent receptor n=1 Tax=Aureispira anguillae TaxID=2864201 RepID=A0A915YC35_9BACT|nr:TonB-dependent receptor [Aureispira anguillae]BDS10352.1 TonB-dependent receptor [Aureispira anguillae]